jgi:formylglycine-generating enzyme required for sulfatase activity
VFLTSENEWYKAAHYDPVNPGADAGGTVDYWLYPTRSDTAPTMATAINLAGPTRGDIGNPGTNVANYNFGADWGTPVQDGNVTSVGTAGAGSASFYGTFDQGGNIYEWNEAIISANRVLRGGSWPSGSVGDLAASFRISGVPSDELIYIGFRVASLESVPEPSSVALAGIGAVVLTLFARRRFQKGTV